MQYILFLATIHCDALLTISPQCTMLISAAEVSRQTKNIPMEEDSSLLKSYHKVQISLHSLQSKLCRQDKTRTHKYPICNAIIFYCLKSNQKVTQPNKYCVCQIREKPQKRREMQTSMQQLKNSGAISTKMMFYCRKTQLREKFTTKKLSTQDRSIHFSVRNDILHGRR